MSRATPPPPPPATSAPPALTASDAIVEQLRCAIDERRSEREIRAILRLWCVEARQNDLTPEHFLVVIKQQFLRIPALQGTDGGSLRNALRESIVRMCIEEYFSTND